jgi:hypothetical protein
MISPKLMIIILPSVEIILSMPRRVRTIWHYVTSAYRTKNQTPE